ncbi:MAG: CocE/NonD family hydrolase [Candidatus Thermoplasmatota archaeon]
MRRHNDFDAVPGSAVVRLLLALLSALLLASALGGCLSGGDRTEDTDDGVPPVDTLSAKQYDILEPEETWVTVSDELRLNNAVYRPDTTEPVPVFVNFSPYWGDSAMTEGDAFSQYMINEYVPRGYAVVLSAIRGTGHSEGCFEVGSDRESQDLNEVVGYFSQQDWSNGNVAAGGKSYDSTSQNGMIAKYPHPALKGLFHVSGITDMYSYTFRMGTPARADSGVFTTEYSVTQGVSEFAGGAGGGGSPTDEDPESLARIVDDAACAELPEHVANSEASTAAGVKSTYWMERDWTQSIAASSWEGSIFFVHGLQDWNVQPSHILPWLDQVHANGHIQVLGWLHQWQQGGTGHVYPMRTDWNETMLRWLDHTLKGKDTGMDRLWGYEVQGDDEQWRRTPTWPPTSDLLLGEGTTGFAGASVGERLTGTMQFTVNATVLNPDPVLTVVVTDQDGEWVTEGVLRGIYKDGLDAPSELVPGTRYTFEFDSYAFDHVVPVGGGLTFTAQGPPTKSIATPTQLEGVLVDGDVDVRYAVMSPDTGRLEPQPLPMDCFTC